MVNVHTSPIPTGSSSSSSKQSTEQKLSASMENKQQQYFMAYKQDKDFIQHHQEAYYDYEDNGEVEEDEYYTNPSSVSSNAQPISTEYSPSTVIDSIIQQKPDDCSPNTFQQQNNFFYGNQPVAANQ